MHDYLDMSLILVSFSSHPRHLYRLIDLSHRLVGRHPIAPPYTTTIWTAATVDLTTYLESPF